MNDDLIARLIAGPGSRELDAEIAKATGTFLLVHSHAGLKRIPQYENVTTSFDASVAFAVELVGVERALRILGQARDAVLARRWQVGDTGQEAIEALPRYVVADAMRARGDG